MDKGKSLHAALVDAAYNWILKNGRCGVAFKELNSLACNGEYPDVIGFASGGLSTLIECKASRADFHADKRKFFRQHPEQGMGTFRYYCCPTGLLKVEDMPEGWGLLYMDVKGRVKKIHSPMIPHKNPEYAAMGLTTQYKHEKNMKAEHGLMYSALRRLHIRGRIDEIYSTDFLPTQSK